MRPSFSTGDVVPKRGVRCGRAHRSVLGRCEVHAHDHHFWPRWLPRSVSVGSSRRNPLRNDGGDTLGPPGVAAGRGGLIRESPRSPRAGSLCGAEAPPCVRTPPECAPPRRRTARPRRRSICCDPPACAHSRALIAPSGRLRWSACAWPSVRLHPQPADTQRAPAVVPLQGLAGAPVTALRRSGVAASLRAAMLRR